MNRKPKWFQCAKCGRFVKIVASGHYPDDFGWWVNYICKVHGLQSDGS